MLLVYTGAAWGAPRLQITKETVGGPEVSFGGDVEYQITVRNTGDVTFKNVLVKDNPAPDCGGYITSKGYFSDEFPPNEEFTYTCTVKNVKKEFVNTATVTGEYADGSSCQDRTRSARSARVSLVLRGQPDVDIRKQAEGNDSRTVITGSDVDFEIEVTNTGELPLTNVVVTDPKVPDCELLIGNLAPGESDIYTCTAPSVEKRLVNTAVVTGTSTLPSGQVCDVRDQDRSTVNVESLECAIVVAKSVTPDTIIPQPPLDCDSISGRPDSLTFKFTGGGCGASNNGQDPDKAECTGSLNPGLAAAVIAGNDKLDKMYLVDGTPVLPGDTFTIRPDGGDFDSNSLIELTNNGGTESNAIHTSCSQPLATGDVFGSLTLVGINGIMTGSENVEYFYAVTNLGNDAQVTLTDDKLGPIPGAGSNVFNLGTNETREFIVGTEILETTTNVVTASAVLLADPTLSCMSSASATVTVTPPPVDACEDGSKPGQLVFEYTGQACDPTANSQGSKTDCAGDPAGASPVDIVHAEKPQDYTITPSSLGIGGLMTITPNDGSFDSSTVLEIRQGGAVLQTLDIHTSCSAPLVPGERFGSLILREYIPRP